MQWRNPDEYDDFYNFPKGSTIAQLINENGELEETDLAYIKPMTGELVLIGKEGNKALGVRQYSTLYKQKDHRYLNHQLSSSLIQEHKRLAVIEHQKRVNCGVKHHEDHRNQIYLRKQGNRILHFRDDNGLLK